MQHLTATIAILVSSHLCLAQEAETTNQAQKTNKKKPNTIRVLAVGEPPISKVTMLTNSIKDRVAQEVEVSSDLIPPKLLFVSKAKEEGQSAQASGREDETGRIPVSLGCMSPSISLKTSLLNLNFAENEGDSSSYFKASFPEGTKNGLVILSKSLGDKNWSKPRLLLLSDDLSEFPRGSVRIINSSSFNMGLIMDGKKLTFKPGQVRVLKGYKGKATPYQVAIQAKDGSWVRIRNTALTMSPDQRMNLVLSNRPSNQEKPAKVNLFAETPPSPTPQQISQN